MELKFVKMTLTLAIFVVLTLALLCPAIAADNSYSVRISCIIPALPGKNVPIIQEAKIVNTKNPVNSPAILQKDTQEVRVTGEGKLLFDVKTLYSR